MKAHAPLGSLLRKTLYHSALVGFTATTLCAQAKVTWSADLEASLAAAKKDQQLTVVYVHEAGETGSVGMLAALQGSPKVTTALGKAHCVVVQVPGCDARAAAVSAFAGLDEPGLGAQSGRSIKKLFGPHAELLTPQLLILDPSGALLAHGIHQQSGSEIVALVDAARKLAGASAKDKCRMIAEEARLLASTAVTTKPNYERLQALATLVAADQMPVVFGAVADRPELEDRLLGAVARVHGWKGAPVRLRAVRCKRNAARVDELLGNLELQVPKARADEGTLALRLPLPVLRQTDDLGGVRWLDGRSRAIADLHGSITVLWFFRPDDASLAKQVAELRPAVEELEARGVRFLGLAVSVDPEHDKAAVLAAGMPFEVGIFRPSTTGSEWFGMKLFPGTVVLDTKAQVVFSDADDAQSTASSFRFFAPFVRGLLELERTAHEPRDAVSRAPRATLREPVR